MKRFAPESEDKHLRFTRKKNTAYARLVAQLTFPDERVVEGADEVALELVAVVGGRHGVAARVRTRRLERWREPTLLEARTGVYHYFSLLYFLLISFG